MSKYRYPYYRRRKYHYYQTKSNSVGIFGLLALLITGTLVGKNSVQITYIISALIFLVAILIILIYIVRFITKSDHRNIPIESDTFPVISDDPRYTLKSGLLTPTENIFFHTLENLVGGRYRVMPQVSLSAIMRPTDTSYHFTNYHDFNKIKAKSVDFVLYNNDLTPYLAIELDDSSHDRQDRVDRDEFVDEVMAEVGLRIIHVSVDDMSNTEFLKGKIFQ